MNIIFDFDGVVINSHKVKTLAFSYIFRTYGKNVALRARKFHLDNIGRSRYYKFKYILKNILKLKYTQKHILKLDKKFDYFIEKKIEKMKPSEHLIKFLKNSKGIKNMYISTGTPQKKIIKILKKKKLFEYFNKVFGSPKTKIYHINQIKKNNEKCIFIGDSYEDFKIAKKKKIQFILKINSENIFFRKKNNLSRIHSFKFLEKKINSKLSI